MLASCQHMLWMSRLPQTAKTEENAEAIFIGKESNAVMANDFDPEDDGNDGVDLRKLMTERFDFIKVIIP